MKLIIDISEQMYLNAKADTLCGADILVSAIKIGIPLEDVRAEIAKPNDIDLGQLHSRSNSGILAFGAEAYEKGKEYALEIIDKCIGKAESEDKRESELEKKARVTQLEGQYLDTGITQGIV